MAEDNPHLEAPKILMQVEYNLVLVFLCKKNKHEGCTFGEHMVEAGCKLAFFLLFCQHVKGSTFISYFLCLPNIFFLFFITHNQNFFILKSIKAFDK